MEEATELLREWTNRSMTEVLPHIHGHTFMTLLVKDCFDLPSSDSDNNAQWLWKKEKDEVIIVFRLTFDISAYQTTAALDPSSVQFDFIAKNLFIFNARFTTPLYFVFAETHSFEWWGQLLDIPSERKEKLKQYWLLWWLVSIITLVKFYFRYCVCRLF